MTPICGVLSTAIGSLLRSAHGQLQGLQDIVFEILGLLNAAAHPHEIVKDTSDFALIFGDAGVRHAGRNLAETLDAAQTLGQREDLGMLAEEVCCGLATLNAEAEHTAAHTIAVLLNGDLPVGVGVQAGVVDRDDVWRRLEGLSDNSGVLGSFAGAQVKGLETAVSQPAVECRRNGANGVLQECKALAQSLRVEGGDTHQDIGVTVDILGHGVNHHVGAVIQRVLDIGAHEGVVDHNQDAMAVGNFSHGFDIHQTEGRVGGGLDPDEFGLIGPNQVLDMQLDAWREGHVDTVRRCHLGEISVSAAVDIGDRNNVRPSGEGLEDGRSSCGAR